MSSQDSKHYGNKLPIGLIAILAGASGTYFSELEKGLEIYYDIFGEDGANFAFIITAGIVFVWWDTRKNLQRAQEVLNDKVAHIVEQVGKINSDVQELKGINIGRDK